MSSESTASETTYSLGKRVWRTLVSACGASLGLGLVLWLIDPPNAPFFLASFGGSTVFLFALASTPAAQPRALFGGHLIGVVCGLGCYHWLGGETWVYVLAMVISLVLMLMTRTVHPPAGANPLIVMQAQSSFATVLPPVLGGLLLLFIVATIWSRLIPGMARYPQRWLERSPPSPTWAGWME